MAVRKRPSEFQSIQAVRAVPSGRRIHGLQYLAAACSTALGAVVFASTYALHPYGPSFYAMTLLVLAGLSYAYERAGGPPPFFARHLAPGTAFALVALLIGMVVMRGIHQHLGTPFAPGIAPLAVYAVMVMVPSEWYAEPDFYLGMLELLAQILGSLA